jgi:hypothetical protein
MQREPLTRQVIETKPSVDSNSHLYHPLIPRELFRFLDTRPEFFAYEFQGLLDEILANPSEINGIDNPIYTQAPNIHTLAPEFFLEQIERNNKYKIRDNDPARAEKEAAIEQYRADAEKLVERVKSFEHAFRNQFGETALYTRGRELTPGLVFDLRDFLIQWIPEWFPIWDCNPITQYSKEQQVMNFRQRTMQHIDCVLLYTYEYFTAWNAQIEKYARPDQDQTKLQVDVYFMMARALLHDLGRWFTQDTRAHEEIPAAFAEKIDEQGNVIETGLLRTLLTLDDGDPSTHPRAFNLGDGLMTLKKIIKAVEFNADVFSKPHKDKVEDYVVAMFSRIQALTGTDFTGEILPVSKGEEKELEYLLTVTAQLEHDRQSELRYTELGHFYMMHSGGGYKDIAISEMKNWYEYLYNRLGGNQEKLAYYVKEAQMLETSRIFLRQLGIAPALIRLKVMERWQNLNAEDDNFLAICFPDIKEVVYSERAAAKAQVQVETELSEDPALYAQQLYAHLVMLQTFR